MDIVSYSKAMQGRKNLDSLNKRLGVGDYKNGDKDVKGTFANVKARLDELEKKRQGLIDKVKVVSIQEGSITDGVWTSNVIHLGEDALELKALKVTGSLISASENLAKGGTASASSFRNIGAGYLPENAFDGQKNNGAGWQTGPGTSPPHWIQYEWTTEKIIDMYMIRARNSRTYLGQSPKSWIFQGWDGEKWVDLDTQINQINWGEYEERRYSFGSSKSFMKYRMYITETNGSVDNDKSIPVNIDEIEFYSKQSSLVEFSRDKVKVSVKTRDNFIDVGNNFEILSKFSKDLQIQVTVLDETYKFNNVAISYQNRPLPNRVSDLETSIHINLNKHNLRVNSLLDKKRYNMKDMIIDDFGDSSGIDLINSKNILHDQQNHKVTPKDKTQAAILITTVESVEIIPTLFLLSSVTEDNTEDSLEYYVSRNNESWMRIEKDKLVSLDKLPEGKELLIKVVLKNGKELHAISYSWL
ncbi:discoidin domain-containing protein [Bacillus pacificus]|nr:discoidin domain-containing protein [Bacillus pacificus]